MEKLKSTGTLTLNKNKSSFLNNSNNNNFSSLKYNPLTSKNILNQISFQTLVNKKSGTPKNINNNLLYTNSSLEPGRLYKKSKNDDSFKKQNSNYNNLNLKDGSKIF